MTHSYHYSTVMWLYQYNIFRRSILNRYFGPLIFNEERIPPFTVGEDVTQEHS